MKIRIISLGEIVTPVVENGIQALALIMAKKSGCELEQAVSQVKSVVIKTFTDLEKFKQGLLSENDFNAIFISALQDVTKIQLTVDEFDAGWNAMNPQYAGFSEALNAAITFHNTPNQKLEFISYTNPKDMRHLADELKKNNVHFQLDDNNNLCEIAGIKLHTTYVKKLKESNTKANIIQHMIISLKQSEAPRNLIFSERKDNSEQDDIKYIHGVNEIEFDRLRKDFDDTTAATAETAEKFSVHSILWRKNSVPLLAILNDENPVHGMLLTSAL